MAGVETTRQKRIVVIVGKTGAGKSTVANELSNSKSYFPISSDYDSQTEIVQHAEVEVDLPDEKFTLRVIDTAGFAGTNTKIKNPEVLEQIKNFFQEKTPEGVNLVLFVLKGGVRFTQEEKESFDFLIKNFEKDISGASALVLTNCENLDDKSRSELIQRFKKNELTKSYASFMGRGIHTVGFPDLEKVLPQLRETYKKTMEKDKQTLINLATSSSKMYLGNQMFEKNFWEKLRKCTIL